MSTLTTSNSDETYLEAFIEQLTTSQWTYQIRRTMDLIRDLDTNCSNELQLLHILTQQLHNNIESTMTQHFDIVEMNDDDEQEEEEVVVEDFPDEINELFGWDRTKNNHNNNYNYNNNKKRKRGSRYGMRFINIVGNDDDVETNSVKVEASVFIPTTEELFEYVMQQQQPIVITGVSSSSCCGTNTTTTTTSTTSDTSTKTLKDIYEQIQILQQNCIQKTHEKTYIAQQAYELIDIQVQRLDTDIQNMELLLQSTGEFPKNIMNGEVHLNNQQSASNVSNMTNANQNNNNNNNNSSSTTSSLSHHPTSFRTATPQQQQIPLATTTTTTPSLLAACQVTSGSEYILCKILFHDMLHQTYKLADEDIESNKIFDLPESQVIVLNPIERLNKGDTIYAVYPDTTSFYPATVVVATHKKSTAAAAQQQPLKQGTYVMVQFVDDADEFGITHDKAVPIQHVMIPPPQLLS